MANLFPAELDLGAITGQVEQLAQLLSDVAAERCVEIHIPIIPTRLLNISHSYALTLRIMLANLRRKVGMNTGVNTPVPTMPPPTFAEGMIVSPTFVDPGTGQQPFTMEELGFSWPSDRGIFSPSAIPVWLQEQVNQFLPDVSPILNLALQSLTDLGLPVNGSDGIFLRMNGANGWTGDFAPMPEAW